MTSCQVQTSVIVSGTGSPTGASQPSRGRKAFVGEATLWLVSWLRVFGL